MCVGIGLPAAGYARGRAERENRAKIAEVESLIEAKRYNDAIIALTQAVKTNPDLFDAAEGLMARIRSIKAEYNATYEQMLQALFEEGDIGKGLALIDRLQELDPYPNETTARGLSRASEAYKVIRNLQRFTEIMDAAAVLVQQGKYVEAVRKYQEGLTLGREDYDAKEYGAIVKNSVAGSLASVSQAGDEFHRLLEELGRAESVLKASLTSGEQTAERLSAATAVLRRLARLEAAVLQAARNLQALNRQIGESSPEKSYDTFLLFAAQLVLGRKDHEREGIAAVLALPREAARRRIQADLFKATEAPWQAALAEYGAGRTAAAAQALGGIAEAYFASLELLSLWAAEVPTPSLLALDQTAQAMLPAARADFLLAQERIRAARAYGELAGIEGEFDQLEQTSGSTAERLPNVRDRLTSWKLQTRSEERAWREDADRLRTLGTAGELQTHIREAEALAGVAAALYDRINRLSVRSLFAYADEALGRITSAEAEYRKRLSEAEKIHDGALTQGRKFPDRALVLYNPLVTGVQSVTAEAERLNQDITSSPSELEASAPLRTVLAELGDRRISLAALQAELSRRVSSAQDAVLQAGRYKQEGLLRLQEARNRIKAESWDAASEGLLITQEAFDSSLSYQEDPEVRRLRDEELPRLAKEIDNGRGREDITVIRRLINDGKRLYSRGEYNSAEKAFLEANRLWKKTRVGEDAEISGWLELVRAAIENVSGREIALSNPLYQQMSQLYNLAYQGYSRAGTLVKQGKTNEALAELQYAENLVVQILSFFPYNSGAQTLGLRIAQLRDPERFRTILDNRFRLALAKRQQGKAGEQEALNDLEVIKVLSPAFPGLDAAIKSLRLSLGLDLPPPDPAKKAEARRLYAEARRVFDQNLRDQFAVALDKLNSAIRLDTDYVEAATLKDRIQVVLGGSRQQFLSSADQARYKEAEGLFLGGQLSRARAIVDELWSNKRNQGYPPLIDLKAKIEARL